MADESAVVAPKAVPAPSIRASTKPTKGTLHKSSREKVPLPLQGCPDKEPVEFPHKWFEENAGKKPFFTYVPLTLADKELAGAVKAGLDSGDAPLDLVICFLVKALQNFKVTLSEDWSSYGIIIGKKGEDISPMDIITATPEGTPITLGRVGEEFPDLNAIYLITCLYRISLLKHRGAMDSYISEVKTRLKTLGATLMTAGMMSCFDTTPSGIEAWCVNPPLRKIMAAIDMFLTRANVGPLSPVKVGTIVSRGRDCGAWSDLLRLQETLGMETQGALAWILSPTVIKEIEQMANQKEEMWDFYGYFYYLSDMGLSKKSPYSSGANPGMHFLCNTIAFFLGAKAAPNTLWIEAPKLATLLNSALLTAYALRAPEELRPIYSENAEQEALITKIAEKQEGASGETESEDIDKEPVRAKWADWMQYYMALDWVAPRKAVEWAQRVAGGHVAPREHTLAHKLVELVKTL
ncbi:nucleoprotein [Blanchseco virus]|uniref:Nucleoprotein n=1 Tax=Blanchseco virus TaxID=2704630 RepID=A0A5B8HB23_9RHAB|nr:nucleoprotein [Blanchseco virus]QDW81034.1 nucleoprotein [Blanchseco virus]